MYVSKFSALARRSRFPYRFKHHTVNLLSCGTGVENRLISTDVLMGKFTDAAKKKTANSKHRVLNNDLKLQHIDSIVLSTAIIGRSSSAPRLQVYKAEDDISMTGLYPSWAKLR